MCFPVAALPVDERLASPLPTAADRADHDVVVASCTGLDPALDPGDGAVDDRQPVLAQPVRYVAPGWIGHGGLARESVGKERLAAGEEAGGEGSMADKGVARRREPVEADEHQRRVEGDRGEAGDGQASKPAAGAGAEQDDPAGERASVSRRLSSSTASESYLTGHRVTDESEATGYGIFCCAGDAASPPYP